MKKLILISVFISLLLIGNVLMYFVIKAYYRSNKIRFPYKKWYLSYNKDVTLGEKLILSALQQVPFVIIYVSYIIYKY